jgi:hypothetical protein
MNSLTQQKKPHVGQEGNVIFCEVCLLQQKDGGCESGHQPPKNRIALFKKRIERLRSGVF